MVALTGYHGTLKHKAINIIKNGFIHSNKNTEWLGKGIYFFTKFNDAKQWALQESKKVKNIGREPAVLICPISCENNEYCDLDVESNMNEMINCVRSVLIGLRGRNSTKLNDSEMRYVACNFFARKRGIKVYAYTFPIRKSNEAGFPWIFKQRQICVNDDVCIKDIREC